MAQQLRSPSAEEFSQMQQRHLLLQSIAEVLRCQLEEIPQVIERHKIEAAALRHEIPMDDVAPLLSKKRRKVLRDPKELVRIERRLDAVRSLLAGNDELWRQSA